jgi:hypothetical protein
MRCEECGQTTLAEDREWRIVQDDKSRHGVSAKLFCSECALVYDMEYER